MSRVPILNILCGIPGSGKSTYAKSLEADGYAVLSSDKLRKELYGDENDQTHNEEVFNTLYNYAKIILENGGSVVIDATNISMKSRRKALSQFSNISCIKVCTVICTPLPQIFINDNNRERRVGADVVNKYLQAFEIPIREEGFDYIQFYYPFEDCLVDIDGLLYTTLNYNQNNHHHTNTLGEHCIRACNLYISENSNYDKDMADALLYHDIGKVVTRSEDENGESHYYEHHNAGAYLCVCSKQFRDGRLSEKSVFLINHHMRPYFWKEQKTHLKYEKLFGTELYSRLINMNYYDREAH